MEFESASQAIKNIKAGWNLGNTLDCAGKTDGDYSVSKYETLWHSPIITREMITAVKDAGFSAVRFPVTWHPHIDENGCIRKEWLDRVEEIANYILDAGLYCIINVHHDSGANAWLRADSDNYAENCSRFADIWKTVAIRFRDYGEKLMFEGFNEMLDINNSWTTPSAADAYEIHNRYNKLFVDTIRSTGGNNEYRNLSLQTYSAGESQLTLDSFVLPDDIHHGHLFAQVHNYDPQGFCWLKSKDKQLRDTWGTEEDLAEADSLMERLKAFSQRINAPVIIGEYGSQDKNNEDARIAHAEYFTSRAFEAGVPCFWWDTEGAFGLLDRHNCTMKYPNLTKAVTDK